MRTWQHGEQATTTALTTQFWPSNVGAIWRRVDLHLHSPGVASFVCPDDADLKSESGRARIADRYVEQLAVQGISIGAITDYNGVRTEWFKPIASEAHKRGITLLPGVEVSFRTGKHGLHVLAIFPSDADTIGLNRFLQSLDRDPATPLFNPDGTHRDIDPKNNVTEALRSVRDRFNCLLILPHPDQKNGFCKSFQTKEAAQFLKDLRPDAIEHIPEDEIKKLQTPGALSPSFWDHLAVVEFSDPKRIDEIGTRFRPNGTSRASYIRLSATDLDALRLALHDPETRLVIGAIPPTTHARIRGIAFSGSGFLGNLSIDWNDDLNVIIGGRGVGKSAILESLRYALAFTPYSDQPYREELVRHALGSGGKVEVLLERPLGDGKNGQYRAIRVWGEEPRVVDMDTQRQVAIRPSELFGSGGGPIIFGQREIYAVSGSEEYRLALLDELIGEEARERAEAVRLAIEQLRANARAILETRERLAKREEYRQRLKTTEHEIQVYEKHGTAGKLREATDLRSDEQHLRGAVDTVQRTRQEWGEILEHFRGTLASAHRDLSRGQSKNKAILEQAAKVIEKLQDDLEAMQAQGNLLLNEIEQSLGGLNARWQEALRPLQDEINRIKREAQTETLDPDRFLRLTEERIALTPLLEELERVENHLKELLQKRQQLLTEIRKRRHGEHQLRRERAGAITNLLEGRLRLEVEFKARKEDYGQRLGSLLKGSGVSQDALDQLVAPEASDGIALAAAVRSGIEEVQKMFSLTSGMADRLVKWLTAEESRLFEMETLIPQDILRVRLKVGDQYRSLEQLSVGQRATAILLLLFALEGRILVLDQPEDDLDNRFVYEDIVQILRDQKGLKEPRKRRQIIVATHNANIPVIGDAELVLALEAHDGRAHVLERASIDKASTRRLVKSIMEGGEEAFRWRVEKYGGLQLS